MAEICVSSLFPLSVESLRIHQTLQPQQVSALNSRPLLPGHSLDPVMILCGYLNDCHQFTTFQSWGEVQPRREVEPCDIRVISFSRECCHDTFTNSFPINSARLHHIPDAGPCLRGPSRSRGATRNRADRNGHRILSPLRC